MEITAQDKKHITRLLSQEKRVNWLFSQFIASIAPEMRKWKSVNSNNVWIRNTAVENKITRRLQLLHDDLVKIIN